MPEGLLRGGGHDDGQSGRHWLVLPLSIAAHACVAAAIVIIPLAATAELPAPHRSVTPYMPAAIVQPLEVPPPLGGTEGPALAAPVAALTFVSEFSDLPVPGTGDAAPGEPWPGIPTGVVGGLGPIGSLVTGAAPAPPPLPPSVDRKPVPVGGLISAPRKTVHVSPVYPEIARSARVDGTVILEAVINERGEIERLKVLRSVPLLDDAAIRAVSGWRYTPTTLNNVAVPVLMTITVTFSLRD